MGCSSVVKVLFKLYWWDDPVPLVASELWDSGCTASKLQREDGNYLKLQV